MNAHNLHDQPKTQTPEPYATFSDLPKTGELGQLYWVDEEETLYAYTEEGYTAWEYKGDDTITHQSSGDGVTRLLSTIRDKLQHQRRRGTINERKIVRVDGLPKYSLLRQFAPMLDRDVDEFVDGIKAYLFQEGLVKAEEFAIEIFPETHHVTVIFNEDTPDHYRDFLGKMAFSTIFGTRFTVDFVQVRR